MNNIWINQCYRTLDSKNTFGFKCLNMRHMSHCYCGTYYLRRMNENKFATKQSVIICVTDRTAPNLYLRISVYKE